MSKYEKYMMDRSIENMLSAEERTNRTDGFKFGVGISLLEGFLLSADEEEYMLYCILNDISTEVMLDNLFTVKGLRLLDHEKAKKNRSAYEAYQKGLKV